MDNIKQAFKSKMEGEKKECWNKENMDQSVSHH